MKPAASITSTVTNRLEVLEEHDDFLIMLRRDELPPHDHCDGCDLGSGVLEDNLHMLIFICAPHLRRSLYVKVCTIRALTAKACRHGVQKYLKARTGLLKMGGERISVSWRAECYWELSYGYLPYKDVKDLIPEVVSGYVHR